VRPINLSDGIDWNEVGMVLREFESLGKIRKCEPSQVTEIKSSTILL